MQSTGVNNFERREGMRFGGQGIGNTMEIVLFLWIFYELAFSRHPNPLRRRPRRSPADPVGEAVLPRL